MSVVAGGTRYTDTGVPEVLLHISAVGWVELHPTLDVALLELSNAVPFKVTPLIYDGIGSDLVPRVAQAWGYGPNRLDAVGQPIGSGETLTSADLSIQGIGDVGQQIEGLPNCDTPPTPERVSSGPLAHPLQGGAPRVVEGAEGGPLFIDGNDPETRVLVGVLKGTTSSAYAFTGIWHIRDWIQQIATDVSPRSTCSEPIPNSAGMSKPAIIEGPDLQLHVVAAAQDGTLHHWQRTPAGVFSGPAPIVGASTDLRPGLGREIRAPAGESLQLGLAFRDLPTQELKYARWGQPTSWSQPISVPGASSVSAVAMAEVGHVAWVGAGDQVGTASYDFETGFAPLPSTTLQNVDVSRGLSLHYHVGVFGPIIWYGYQTNLNEWGEVRGNLVSVDGGLAWGWFPPVSTAVSWDKMEFFGPTGQGGSILAIRSVGGSSIVEHFARLSSPTGATQLIQIGSNRIKVNGEIGVTYAELDDVWVVSESVDAEPPGLMLRRSTDCFANDW